MTTALGELSCKEKLREFKQRIDSTQRMILSAKFGDGKTFFLKKVADDKLIQRDYRIFTLYPVNYAVSVNENIFEYIKRDIILQLEKDGVLNDIDIEVLADSIFTIESLKDVLRFLISFIPGSDVYKMMMDKLFDIRERYVQNKETAKKYYENFQLQKGGIYEEDGYTKMIRAGLEIIKNGFIGDNPHNKGKKTVLVIEDLDRLDPAHLFRILNVISAHIGDSNRPDIVSNKFGFDKIVLVMDYETTGLLFEHFYGKGASYDGYMSKFISDEPFRYSLRDLAEEKFKKVLSQLVGFPVDYEWFDAIRERISKYSIRDMNRICAIEYKTRVLEPYVELLHMKFSTNLPFFKLIVYMSEMGIKENDIICCLKDGFAHPDKEKWLALMYPVYLVNSRRQIDCFEDKTGIESQSYLVNIQENGGYVVSVTCTKGYVYQGEYVSIDDNLETKIRNAFRIFSEYVNLSAMDRSAVEYGNE